MAERAIARVRLEHGLAYSIGADYLLLDAEHAHAAAPRRRGSPPSASRRGSPRLRTGEEELELTGVAPRRKLGDWSTRSPSAPDQRQHLVAPGGHVLR
jgi:hypothetical protein